MKTTINDESWIERWTNKHTQENKDLDRQTNIEERKKCWRKERRIKVVQYRFQVEWERENKKSSGI